MPIIATSNCWPPAATSRVVTWRRVPSSSTVYLTLMPVSCVKSFGVRSAMSFICGLSTIATLISPPLPDAGEPPDPESSPPPHPTTTAARTASRVGAHRMRLLPLIVLLLRLHAEVGSSAHTRSQLIAVGSLGCQALNAENRAPCQACSLR